MTVGSTWCARAATRRTFLARRSTPCPTDNAGLAHGCARSRAVTGTSPAFGRIHVAKGPGAYPLVDQMPGGNPQVVASQPCRRGAVSGLQQMRRGGRRLVHGKRRRVGVRRSCGLRRFRCAADAITDVTPALADVNGGRRHRRRHGRAQWSLAQACAWSTAAPLLTETCRRKLSTITEMQAVSDS
jgi:hypothetical protein